MAPVAKIEFYLLLICLLRGIEGLLMSSDFKFRPFQGAIILWAVRWYCRYGISYRDLEDMLEERGIDVDHTTIYRWVHHYAPETGKRLGYSMPRLTGFTPHALSFILREFLSFK